MRIDIKNAASMYENPRNMPFNAGRSKTLSFSSLMQAAVENKAALTQEAAGQERSDPSCDCEGGIEQCQCDGGKETEETAEAKKTGIAACMDCIRRKNGQCAMWNGKNKSGALPLFPISFLSHAAYPDAGKILDMRAPLDVMARARQAYDFTYAYAAVEKKFIKAGAE